MTATGELYAPDGTLAGTGYAGQPPHVNDASAVCLVNEGPLPPGVYFVGDPVEGTHMGPFALPLTPDADNDMKGRSGFYCHGDSIERPGYASNGCIVQQRSVREVLHASEIKQLQVVETNS